MVRGLYTSAAGALVAQNSIDVIANNLANASSQGFKSAILQVEAQPSTDLYRFQTDPGQVPANRTPGVPTQSYVGQMGSGSQVYATPTNFTQGPISINGNTYSFALSGPGFFAVQDPQTGQVVYTRDGAFMRGEDGNLRTVDGGLVLDAGGNAIPLPQTGKVEVDTQGNIDVDGVVQAGQLAAYEFTNEQNLQPTSGTNFIDPGTAGVQPAQNTSIIQYAEEKSNGDVVRSIVQLITNQRWFEANEKSIQTQDDATNQAISTVGRTSGT